jgi:hypothetical protein
MANFGGPDVQILDVGFKRPVLEGIQRVKSLIKMMDRHEERDIDENTAKRETTLTSAAASGK